MDKPRQLSLFPSVDPPPPTSLKIEPSAAFAGPFVALSSWASALRPAVLPARPAHPFSPSPAEANELFAARVARLAPSHRDPEQFRLEKDAMAQRFGIKF
jgi:hypothetical protein